MTGWTFRNFAAITRNIPLGQELTLGPAKSTLGALAALGIIYAINRLLSHAALNGKTNSWDWNEEVVLVTGASNGLGEILVRQLAARGIKNIVAVDLHTPKTTLPPNCHFYSLDVTSTEKIRDVAQQIRNDVGEPTVLINNAGVATLKPILEETEAEIRRTFDVNVIAHFLLIKEFLPSMIRHNHGHIITVASMASYVTVASNVDYSCSKAAALAFHEGVLQELKHKYGASQVRASAVHPMWIKTAMFDAAMKAGQFHDFLLDPDEVAIRIIKHMVAGKSGQIFLPAYFSLATGFRGFPTWVQEWARGSRANLLKTS